jgi:hypothetical protein
MTPRYPGTLFLVAILPLAVRAEEPFRYTEGRHGPAELRYVQGVPVLTVGGSAEEMAEQVARLTLHSSGRLLHYPKDVLDAFFPQGNVAGVKRETGLAVAWRGLLTVGEGMVPHFPPDHKREFDALLKASGVDRDVLLAANTMFDVKKMFDHKKLIFGCSSLVVSAERSQTGQPFMGRNLDFPTMGYLQDYSMVIVYRPTGKHAFLCIGFPGVVGVLSGMNEKGLSVAVLEVYASSDGAARYQAGTPYAMTYRRILEECSTVAEAIKLLEGTKRSTMCNLAICDKHGGGILEITPKSVVYRRAADGVTPCTNHFNSTELAIDKQGNLFDTLDRYQKLEKAKELPKVGLSDLTARLHDANLGDATFQTMIFEPATLKLHLALAPCPSSGNKLRVLDVPLRREPKASGGS